MEEKFIMMDILATEKSMIANTTTALNEASCDAIYQVYFDLFDELTMAAKDLFTLCYNRSWYQLEAAPQNKIEQEINKLCNELNQDQ